MKFFTFGELDKNKMTFLVRKGVKQIGFLSDVFNKNKEIPMSYTGDLFSDKLQSRTYLKEMAIDTCSNFIARTISQTDFRFMKDKKRVKNDWDKLLNVRPNKDESSADFWQSVINKLVRENEVLIIPYENQLLIADSFHRREYALFADVFESVTLKNFTFTEKKFLMDDVIYLTYNNAELSDFLDGLSNDYADIFATLIEGYKSNFEIRSMLKFDTAQRFDDGSQSKVNETVMKLITPVKRGIHSVFSVFKGSEYVELPNNAKSTPTIEEIDKVKNALIKDVARILGIPQNLIMGDTVDLDGAMKSYISFCVNPLLKKIKDELNAKIEKANDEEIVVLGISTSNIIDKAESVDKLVASGSFTRNEVREIFGYERVDDPELDKYVITKNYETVESSKGGENIDG